MEKLFQKFVSDDAGTMTADWIVLVAGAVMLFSAVFGTLSTSSDEIAADTGGYSETQVPVI